LPVSFNPAPDWYRNVDYFEERERGFDDSEDLFMPGALEIALPPLPLGGYVYVAAGTEPCDDIDRQWEAESRSRTAAQHESRGLVGHLTQVGEQFCTTTPQGRPALLAGYPWFEAWGRDTLISLPGLTFHAGREEFGLRVLADLGQHIRNGLVPNMFSESGEHAYNSVDASLWYAFALQQMLTAVPDGLAWAHGHAWEALKSIIKGYRKWAGHGHFCGCRRPAARGRRPHPAHLDGRAGGRPAWSRPVTVAPLRSTPCGTTPLPLPTAWPPPTSEPLLTGERQRAGPARCVFAPLLDKRGGRASG
jgi:predicted glycogen debranching enzyme